RGGRGRPSGGGRRARARADRRQAGDRITVGNVARGIGLPFGPPTAHPERLIDTLHGRGSPAVGDPPPERPEKSSNASLDAISDDWNRSFDVLTRALMSVGHSDVAETELETFDQYCYKKLAFRFEFAYLPEPWG